MNQYHMRKTHHSDIIDLLMMLPYAHHMHFLFVVGRYNKAEGGGHDMGEGNNTQPTHINNNTIPSLVSIASITNNTRAQRYKTKKHRQRMKILEIHTTYIDIHTYIHTRCIRRIKCTKCIRNTWIYCICNKYRSC
jgi:hypothetical protein